MASKFKTRREAGDKPTPASERPADRTDFAAELDKTIVRSRLKHGDDCGNARRKIERYYSSVPAPEVSRDQTLRKRLRTKEGEKGKPGSNTANVANVALPRRVTIKPEQTVVLGNGSKIGINGLRDGDGTRYIHFRQGRREVTTRYDVFHGSSSEGSAALKQAGIIVVGGMGDVREAVDQIKRFHSAKIVSKPGWTKHGFAAASGRVYVAGDEPYPLVTFAPVSGMLDQGGTLAGWLDQVAAPLAEHDLASFMMMAMFAAPLLRWTNRADNIGLELAGPPGCGKSTLQLIMASAAGPAIGDDDATYWRSLNATNNALEMVMEHYNDMTMVLDEAGLVEGAGRTQTRAATTRDIAFRLAAGQVKHRFGTPAGPRSRLVYVLSTNQPIATLLGSAHVAEADAIADRLITLPILNERPHGIFDNCPPSFPSSGALAEALKRAAAENYGHAMPVYLAYLAKEAARRPKALRRKVEGYVAEFIERAGTNTNDGSHLRVAQAIGLVYAGGRLAKTAGALPPPYQCGRAALAALSLHRAHARVAISFDDRLVALMRHPATIDLAKVEITEVAEDVRSRCPAFLYTGRSGPRELLVPIVHMDRVFPGWQALSDDPDFMQRLNPPKGRKVRDRPIGEDGALVPAYRFIVTDLEA
ncbi:DUF927 domain-containing protein [Sphingomonas rubra]|uniref:DUF927 domain-containing protein n=1 Tax=Sphingomonas rubra TaxID=634430 RepID=A0A1I5QH17_9SPHN|nr:DUF927 domain-containing protein [Sphingomonas rubra]SFP45532.1 protein of unknown function [Sphingomonas rubra]